MQVYKQSGTLPQELQDEVLPEFWDEPIFDIFFEIYNREAEFFQTIYYYQQVMNLELAGDDLAVLFSLWKSAGNFLRKKDEKKRNKSTQTPKGGKGKR